LPEHLPRERIVYPVPLTCPCCGDATLRKIGEDVTETLELVPRQWKVVQHVREKFSCRVCETIAQPPAPSHPISRGRAGPGLLAHILFSKYGLHLPLNRQSAVYAREGIELDVSTLADWVGAAAATLMPLLEAIHAHVFAAARRVDLDQLSVGSALQAPEQPAPAQVLFCNQSSCPPLLRAGGTGQTMPSRSHARHHEYWGKRARSA
jgi:transposase